MEAVEKILEAYVRYVLEFFTIPNIKCANAEIDLIALSADGQKLHVESSVHIGSPFSELRLGDYKQVKDHATSRRCLTFFIDRKFGHREVHQELLRRGFSPGSYRRVIVSWGWKPGVEQAAKEAGIELWDFRDILQKLRDEMRGKSSYFKDDTLRTVQLLELAKKEEAKREKH